MANTYTQIHIQLVFVVKFRNGLISISWKEELYKYIAGIISENNHKLLAINGMPDHLHIFVGLRPTQSISDLCMHIKGSSSKWINSKGFLKCRFEWQKGFGAFSYSKVEVPKIIRYIRNQEIHHKSKSFKEEYEKFLKDFDVNYEERYIFEEPQ